MLFDQTSTTLDLSQARIDIVVLPIGAIEQHSGHLPMGTDWLAARALSQRVAEQLSAHLDVYLLPALPFSLSQCHGPLPGTVWLKPTTLADTVRAIVVGLSKQGMHRFLLVNGHGGNFCMDAELREINLTYPEIVILDAAWLGSMPAAGPSGRVTGGDIHAGAGETATQMSLNPKLVGTNALDSVPAVGREFLDYLYLPTISPSGVWGRPSLATGETGQANLEAAADKIARAAPRCFDAIAAHKSRPAGSNLP